MDPTAAGARYNRGMRHGLALISALAITSAAFVAADGNTKLKAFLNDDKVPDGWIYEDIDAGYAAAKKSGKPLLVSFRCVP